MKILFIASMVEMAYPCFLKYHNVANILFVGDAVKLLGDDVAVPDRPKRNEDLMTNRPQKTVKHHLSPI